MSKTNLVELLRRMSSGYMMWGKFRNEQDFVVASEAEEEILRRWEENEKYRAFWEQSRLADQQMFENYVWKDS